MEKFLTPLGKKILHELVIPALLGAAVGGLAAFYLGQKIVDWWHRLWPIE